MNNNHFVTEAQLYVYMICKYLYKVPHTLLYSRLLPIVHSKSGLHNTHSCNNNNRLHHINHMTHESFPYQALYIIEGFYYDLN